MAFTLPVLFCAEETDRSYHVQDKSKIEQLYAAGIGV